MDTAQAQALAEEFIAARKEKNHLTEQMQETEARLDEAEASLYKALIENQMEELSVHGYKLKPILKFTANVKDERTIRAVRRRGYGRIVKPTIHPSTLHAFIREQAELNAGEIPEWITKSFDIRHTGTISMRKE